MREDRTMNGTRIRTAALVVLLGMASTACGGAEEAPAADVGGDTMGGAAEGMQGMEGMRGTADMRRHAQEADSMAAAMRRHMEEIRELPPGEWHRRMGEHVTRASGMLALMNRQMGEMDMGMGMADEEMGRMMGMTGEEHRRMMEDMQALRADLEQLQTASRDQVEQRMPAHLDRLERMVEMMEESAEHMRSM